jgi:ABC-2 type transport system permease protein
VLEFVKREMGEDLGPDAVVVAQVAVGLAAGLIGAAVMLVIGVTLYDAQMPESPVTALGVFALASSSLLALGFLIASVTRSSRAAQGLGMILFFPMWLLSGAGPPPAVLTEGMRTISKVLPLTYAVSALQDAWLGRKLEPTDVIVLTAILIVAGGLSIRLFRP